MGSPLTNSKVLFLFRPTKPRSGEAYGAAQRRRPPQAERAYHGPTEPRRGEAHTATSAAGAHA